MPTTPVFVFLDLTLNAKCVTLSQSMSITKKIHYCWLGSAVPASVLRQVAGWKKCVRITNFMNGTAIMLITLTTRFGNVYLQKRDGGSHRISLNLIRYTSTAAFIWIAMLLCVNLWTVYLSMGDTY